MGWGPCPPQACPSPCLCTSTPHDDSRPRPRVLQVTRGGPCTPQTSASLQATPRVLMALLPLSPGDRAPSPGLPGAGWGGGVSCAQMPICVPRSSSQGPAV